MDLDLKIEEYARTYGVDALNLVLKRHDLADEKRKWFLIRYDATDPDVELSCTEEMNRLTEEINSIDVELERYGITAKKRPIIIKDLKKYSPDGWRLGFTENI